MLVALVTMPAGCSKSPINNDESPTRKDEPQQPTGYQRPEEVFSAFMAAGAKEDWKTMCECLTDDSRDKMAVGLVLVVAIGKSFATTPEQKAKFKLVDDVLAKHGIPLSQKQGPASPPSKDPKNFEKDMMKVLDLVKDRNAFIADMLVAFKQMSDDPQQKNPVGGDFDFKEVKLEDVKIQGDSATANAVAKHGNKEARQPVNFKKAGGGWKIEFPDKGGQPVDVDVKSVPPSQAEKAVIALVDKLDAKGGSRLRRDPALPGQPITYVSLGLTKVTDDDLKVLAGLPQLKELHLNATSISDTGLKALAPLKQLQVLNVMGTRISDAGLEEVSRFTSLRELWLSSTDVTDAGLKHLAGLPNLDRVDLYSSKVGNAGLKELAKLTKLKSLDLSKSRVTGVGVKELAALAELETLNLSELPLTDEGVKHLAGLKKLRFLTLYRTQVGDAGLKDLGKIESLIHLNLENTKVSDAGLKDLAKIDSLRSLSLDNTKVSDAGLQALAGLKNLAFLSLRGTAVSEAGVAQLTKALPKAYITR
jgi:hypothetical protein